MASLPSVSFFTYPLTMRVDGAPQMTSQPVSSIFLLFSTALWDLANSRPVHSLMLSSHFFLCMPCRLLPFTVPCNWFWPDLMNRRYVHTTLVCVSLRWPRGPRVVRLPAGSWLGFWLTRRTKHGLKARKYYIALRYISGIVVLFSPCPVYSMTGIS